MLLKGETYLNKTIVLRLELRVGTFTTKILYARRIRYALFIRAL